MGKDFSKRLSSDLAGGADTIVARASPAGRSALAIIRLSGPQIVSISRTIFGGLTELTPWKAALVDIHGVAGSVFEKVILLYYRGPRSFTGEDMIEIMCHGSPYIVSEIVRSCVRAGAREAFPGEFTRRAVANGKMDLVQAEGVRDMIDAETRWQARIAREQMSGALSVKMSRLREGLIRGLALLEVNLDFSNEEVVVENGLIEQARADVLSLIDELLASYRFGESIREGLRVVIVGRPNAGKSTLFNRLVRDERAIVSPHPGTTRDLVEAEIEISGIPITLVDTAGLRDTIEPVEAEGVRRAQAAIAEADCVILLWSAESDEEAPQISIGQEADAKDSEVAIVQVLTKTDLQISNTEKEGWLPVSALDGDGMELLFERLKNLVNQGIEDFGGRVAISSRHRQSLLEARRCVVADHRDAELAAEEIRWAIKNVENLIGMTDDEDIFDEVFSGFCIGK